MLVKGSFDWWDAITPEMYAEKEAEYQKKLTVFCAEHFLSTEFPNTDPGLSDEQSLWPSVEINVNDENWKNITLPYDWSQEFALADGALWLRKNINIPEPWRGQTLYLHFAHIDDSLQAWANKHKLGNLFRKRFANSTAAACANKR